MKQNVTIRMMEALRDLSEAVARARMRSSEPGAEGVYLAVKRYKDAINDGGDRSDDLRLEHLERICSAASAYRAIANRSKSKSFDSAERARLAKAVNSAIRLCAEWRRVAALHKLGMPTESERLRRGSKPIKMGGFAGNYGV